MALDRFVCFEQGPTKEEAGLVVRNFFGEGASVEYRNDRWFVSLPGAPTWELEGIEKDLTPKMRNTERWIEVCWTSDHVDVLTRNQDAFTNALANGLAQVFIRNWKGTSDNVS